MPDFPGERLTRSFDFTVERADESSDGLTLEGYAAVFNSPTLIDSAREGRFTEIIAPGAFSKSLSERTPVLQFDHGRHPMIGSIPLGVVRNIKEDDHGLFVRARLSDNWLIQPVRDAIHDGSVTGMSFQFAIVRQDVDRATSPKTHLVREVALFELGPVVFPAYAATSVGVRSSQLLEVLSDPAVRADLARLLTFGNPVESDAAPDQGTSDEATDTPPVEAPVGSSKAERMAAYRRVAHRYIKEYNA